MNRYEQMFARLARSDERAFGAFVMIGDPDLSASGAILDSLVSAGADMLEVGIPFSDPIADGPVIQAAASRALRSGATPARCLDLLAAFRARHPSVPLGILTYANLLVARGEGAFYAAAAAAGVDSILVADVPALEAKPFVEAAGRAAIAPVMIAAPGTPSATLRRIAGFSRGYTYCVARPGVTGADEEIELDHSRLFRRLRSLGAPPPVLGFGISRPAHVRTAIEAGAAGAICGSAIVQLVEGGDYRAGKIERFVQEMKRATRL